MNIIIFSKNRACQLDLLLRSVSVPFDTIRVIYTADTPGFRFGYAICRKEHDVNFIREENLKQDTLNAIKGGLNCFLVDDDVFYRKLEKLPEIESKQVYSLRLHDKISRKHFDYKHSLDGNIYREEDIRPIIESIDFNNPNELEARMQRFKDFELLHGEGYMVGVPHNRVSKGSKCHFSGRYSEVDLNGKYLHGKRLEVDPKEFENLTDVHKEIEYAFRPK